MKVKVTVKEGTADTAPLTGGATLCESCEENAARLYCDECSCAFCEQCAESIHKGKAFRKHLLQAVVQTATPEPCNKPIGMKVWHETRENDTWNPMCVFTIPLIICKASGDSLLQVVVDKVTKYVSDDVMATLTILTDTQTQKQQKGSIMKFTGEHFSFNRACFEGESPPMNAPMSTSFGETVVFEYAIHVKQKPYLPAYDCCAIS